MSLSDDEYVILKHLLFDPIIPYSKLAKKVDLSPPTVKKRIDALIDTTVLRGFHAEYFPESMGLESHVFLLHVGSQDKLQIIERVLFHHPYLVVMSRCYGAINGIMIKVHVPDGSIDYFVAFLNYLQENDLVDQIVHSSQIGKGIKTRLDLNYWDPTTSQWIFDWELWEKNIDSVDYVPRSDYLQTIMKEKPVNVLKQMRYNDFQILNELLADTTKKHTDIAKKLGIPEYTLSRRLKFLSENIIRNYLVDFDRSFFGLEDDFIFKVISSQRAMTKIIYLLRNLPLPFESDFRQTDDGFMWRMLLPPKDKLKIINLLWSLFPALQIMVLDPHTRITKAFNPDNYSFKNSEWKASKDYIVDQVLDKARREFLLV